MTVLTGVLFLSLFNRFLFLLDVRIGILSTSEGKPEATLVYPSPPTAKASDVVPRLGERAGKGFGRPTR